MVETNIKIIAELKEVLNIINTDLEIKKRFTESETDFTKDQIEIFLENLVEQNQKENSIH